MPVVWVNNTPIHHKLNAVSVASILAGKSALGVFEDFVSENLGDLIEDDDESEEL